MGEGRLDLKLPRFLPFGVPSRIAEPHHTALWGNVRTELCLPDIHMFKS